jgi:hypothetical protein
VPLQTPSEEIPQDSHSTFVNQPDECNLRDGSAVTNTKDAATAVKSADINWMQTILTNDMHDIRHEAHQEWLNNAPTQVDQVDVQEAHSSKSAPPCENSRLSQADGR